MATDLDADQRLACAYVLDDVLRERERQQREWGEQNHADGTGPQVTFTAGLSGHYLSFMAKARTNLRAEQGRLTYADILLEEVFEACAEDDPLDLRAELVQVAAVAVAWVEKLDRATAWQPAGIGAS